MKLKNQNVNADGTIILKNLASKDDAVIEAHAKKKINEDELNPPIKPKKAGRPKKEDK